MRRTNQGGSVASFIVVGALLVLVTVGLLYAVRQQPESGEIAKEPEITLPGADNNTDNQNRDDKTPAADEGGTQDKTSTDESSTTDETTDDETTEGDTETTVDEIPQTGPADTMMQLVAVGALTAVSSAYYRSRKVRHSL